MYVDSFFFCKGTHHSLQLNWHSSGSRWHKALSDLISCPRPSSQSSLLQWFPHLHQPLKTRRRKRIEKKILTNDLMCQMNNSSDWSKVLSWKLPCKITVDVSKDLHEVRVDGGEGHTSCFAHVDGALLSQVHVIKVDELKLRFLFWPSHTNIKKHTQFANHHSNTQKWNRSLNINL